MWTAEIVAGRPAWRHQPSGIVFRQVHVGSFLIARHPLTVFGSANELCADAWIRDYAGAPADARPRPGDGPRTVRGGAAEVYPWQGCDEWLLLLSVSRYELSDFAAIRPVAALPRA